MGNSNYSYCKNTTTSHEVAVKIPNCLKNIDEVFVIEGHSGSLFFSNDTPVIDMDLVESYISSIDNRTRSRSMDLAFGIKEITEEIDCNCKVYMLLTELKLRVTDLYKIKGKDLKEKVNGSISMIGTSIPIYYHYIFVFSESHKEEARSRMRRMIPTMPLEYYSMGCEEFRDWLFNSTAKN